MRSCCIILLVILALYVILGVLYAVRTPAWQAPNEPAHYNYVRFVATTSQLPRVTDGRLPPQSVVEMKVVSFRPNTTSIRFATSSISHQLVHHAARRRSMLRDPARCCRCDWPRCCWGWAWCCWPMRLPSTSSSRGAGLGHGPALVAFLPQHLSTVSQVGNDVLAELSFAAVGYILVGWVLDIGDAGDLDERGRTGVSRALSALPSACHPRPIGVCFSG